MGLLPRLELTPGISVVIGYGTDSVLPGIGADSEPEETPVLRMTELDVAGIAPLLVPEASSVDAGTVSVGELRIDDVLWTGFDG